ncbi:hypothetical protein DFQ28_003586 [Apophysomyces sp. BC1034]|nr:hypothetical protein DFQ28_003586 [Apophysomyces sp. BC1034]
MRTNYKNMLTHIGSHASLDTLALWLDPERSQDNAFVAAGTIFGGCLNSYEFIGIDLSNDRDQKNIFRAPIWRPKDASEITYIRLFEDVKNDIVYSMLRYVVKRQTSYERLARILREDYMYEFLSGGCIENWDIANFLERKKIYRIVRSERVPHGIPTVTVVRDDRHKVTITLDDLMNFTHNADFLTEDWIYLYDTFHYILFEQYDAMKEIVRHEISYRSTRIVEFILLDVCGTVIFDMRIISNVLVKD